MPSYITSPQAQQVNAIYPGNNIALVNNAASDADVTTTLQVAIGPDPSRTGSHLTLINSTDQTATVQVAQKDVGSQYQTLSEGGTAITAASDTAVNFDCGGPWVRCTFQTAPTTGSLVLCR